MSEIQLLKWVILPVGVVVLGVAFGFALVIPLLALILYCGKGL